MTSPRHGPKRLLVLSLGLLLLLPLTACLGRSDSLAPVIAITEPRSGTTRNTDDLEARRQAVVGQICGMIADIRPVGELMRGMVDEAARLLAGMNALAAR